MTKAASKYEMTDEEKAKLGLESNPNVISETTSTNDEPTKDEPTNDEPTKDEPTSPNDEAPQMPSWVTEEQKEVLKDYFERHPFLNYFWMTESGHLFYEECDLLASFKEPTQVNYAKILREWAE